jgi:hypothetical protein
LLKSARELANDNNVQGNITLRGNSLTVVNKSTQPNKNIHVWSSAFMIYGSLMLEKFPSKGFRYCPREGLIRTSTTPCRQPPKKSSETWLSEVYVAHHNLPSPRSNP